MRIAILKYNAGNTASVVNALHRIEIDATVTDSAEQLLSADGVIFPGVGEASTAMRYLRDRHLDKVIRSLTQPVLGICLGMQLMCSSSEENDTACLGIFPHKVIAFGPSRPRDVHVGWNQLSNTRSPLFEGVSEGTRFYFVHKFAVGPVPEAAAFADFGGRFSAAIAQRNYYAVQFHPERSGDAGERVLQNFITLCSK